MAEYNPETAARVVQLALTPVFLLSATAPRGAATLLAVFSARLARVDALSHQAKEPIRDELLKSFRRRSHALHAAVVMSALAGGLTCATVLVVFLSEIRSMDAARLLFLGFGGAILLTLASLTAFVIEMLPAARGAHRTVDRHDGAGNSSRIQ